MKYYGNRRKTPLPATPLMVNRRRQKAIKGDNLKLSLTDRNVNSSNDDHTDKYSLAPISPDMQSNYAKELAPLIRDKKDH